MEYNTQRPKLKITDYGRNITKLIEYAKGLETKAQRNDAAEIILRVMAQVNPSAKRNEGYHRELWEHLMILANWELDVDCPYELKHQDELRFHPEPLNCQGSKIQFRHYGHCLEDMIRAVAEMEDGEEKELLTALLVAQMKKSYMVWNRTTIDSSKNDDYNDIISKQLDIISNGKLKEGELRLEVNPYLARPSDFNKHKPTKNKKKRR